MVKAPETNCEVDCIETAPGCEEERLDSLKQADDSNFEVFQEGRGYRRLSHSGLDPYVCNFLKMYKTLFFIFLYNPFDRIILRNTLQTHLRPESFLFHLVCLSWGRSPRQSMSPLGQFLMLIAPLIKAIFGTPIHAVTQSRTWLS